MVQSETFKNKTHNLGIFGRAMIFNTYSRSDFYQAN